MASYILKSYRLNTDPLALFRGLSRERGCFFLDSSLSHPTLGRFSFLGADPFYRFESRGSDPFCRLRQLFSRYRITIPGCRLPLQTGAVGYFSYDLGAQLEKKVRMRSKRDIGIPDCVLNFYNTVIAVDTLGKKLHIIATGFPETKEHLARLLCKKNFKRMQDLLATRCFQEAEDKFRFGQTVAQSNFSKADYLAAVKKAKKYIRQGDIYQVNLSQRFSATSRLSPVQLYGRLRAISPACFGGYFDAGYFQIISASPERFLCVQGQDVSTRPMKGTRPRRGQRSDDQRAKKELWDSPKDKAELTMIVDLERNDLGRVCGYGSVRVKTMRELETYATVFQTTATIQGRLYHGKDRMDLLRACFPGGSITGCPKIRAMEIIEELEPDRRCIYTGCLGYMSFSGAMDFNVLIRTILRKGPRLYFGAGGGIVADSKPHAEYEETLVKARGLMRAIGLKEPRR